MKTRLKVLISTILILISTINIFALNNSIQNGLTFQSFEVDQDKRTGLNLTPSGKINIQGGFTLEFEIKMRKSTNPYGYVFRLIGSDSINVDLISHFSVTDHLADYAFSLVVGSQSVIRIRKTEFKNQKLNNWTNICLIYDKERENFTLKIDNVVKQFKFKTDMLSKIDLSFGYNSNPLFATTDVPSMTVRNIRIFDQSKTLKRFWKLEKHSNLIVFDECARHKAICVNPIWEIDKHVKWTTKSKFSIPYLFPQLAFSKKDSRVYVAKHKKIYRYDLLNDKIDTITASKGEIFNTKSNQLVYDERSGQLISYTFDRDNLAKFDFGAYTWTNENTQSITPQFWHHSKYLDTKENVLFTIGGYGYHKYKGDVMRYSLSHHEWKQHDISTMINPRYLGSLGALENGELLYFGGYGSKTGNQEEFPHNYYDLYQINPSTLDVKKLWEIKEIKENFTNSNSLIVNNDKKSFYNLVYSNSRYSTNLKLIEYDIAKPNYEIVGDTLPYKFKDIESYCDLYYSSKTSELLAVTAVQNKNLTEISIYSIAYPPLKKSDVIQEEETSLTYQWLLLLVPLTLGGYLLYRRKLNKDKINYQVNEILDNQSENYKVELLPSSINLLGYFQIIDNEGINITGNFTATTTQMFLSILLYTIKNGQGISTQELTENLWPEKDTDSARNSRNVYMSKLRLLVKNIGNLELVNQNSYWSANIGADIFCDYKAAMQLIDKIKRDQEPPISTINELIDVAKRGVLLPNLQEEWLDAFKGEFTSMLIDTLNTCLKQKEVVNNQIVLLKISDAILKHDNIDEYIIQLKIRTLLELNKKTQAKQCFQKFKEDFKNFMGVPYTEEFEQFVEKKM